MLRGLAAILLLGTASGVFAQAVDESALDALDKTGVTALQPIREPAGAAELRAAIRRISYNSADADALADAGNASLALGDANAALNFLTRANAQRPNNGRIVASLAAATVRTENPFEALRLFDDAIRLGISDRSIAADRALAFDLLGNFARAQQDYKLARTAASSDDLMIRQAISLSLAGQKADADTMLLPLLQSNNTAAWRARAFILAARGDFRESTKVTQGFMDVGSAQRMERYLRLMPDLTGAQQAAAIHLGHFPASQYVGRDSDQLRRVASTIPAVAAGPGESRLIPTGAPLGPKTAAKAAPLANNKKRESNRERKAREREELKVAVATIPVANRLPKTDTSRLGTDVGRAKVAEAQTARISSMATGGLPPPESARPLVSVAVLPRPETVVQVQPALQQPVLQQTGAQQAAPLQPPSPPRDGTVITAQAIVVTPQPPQMAIPVSVPTIVAVGTPAITATTALAVRGPTPSGAPIAASSALVVATAVAEPVIATPRPQAAPTPAFDLASVVSAIEIPQSEQVPSAVPVDLKRIQSAISKVALSEAAAKAAKPDAKLAAKAKMEAAQPARFWVQIATGEANALGYDYRKWQKKTPALFKGHAGSTAVWGRTSRLLVGPFPDLKASKKWEGDFKKAGGDGFMWKSETGVAVTALKSK